MITKESQTGKKKKKPKTPIPLGAKQCAECGCSNHLEIHHVFASSSRKASSYYQCVEWLCNIHHRSNVGIHGGNKELDLRLKQKHQKRLEADGMTRRMFILTFGRNYL